MSILSSGRIKVALSMLGAAVIFLFVPAVAAANTCNIVPNSFNCLTSASNSKAALIKRAQPKRRNVKSSYRVAAVRSGARMSDAGAAAKSGRKSARKQVRRKVRKSVHKKARRKVRRSRKASRRSARRARRSLRKKRSLRKNKSLRTIGRRLNSKSVRKLSKRSRRSVKKSRKSASKRGWRTRSRGLGYAAAHRGVSTSCFPARLKKLLKKVSAHYGRKLRITSGFRSRRHNRRIGGARRSQHIHCTAADFYIPGVNKMALARYLKRMPGRGGVGTYCGNRTVHLDVGPRRTWHWNCRKSRRRYAKKRYKRRNRAVRRSARKHSRAKRHATRFRGTLS